jgi:hypothetical protein
MSKPSLSTDNKDHIEYINRMVEMERYFRDSSINIWKKANDFWELFLAIQEDTRDPIDESWRSDVFVPLPFVVTRTKAALITELLGNAEPVWQAEATRETGDWYEQSKHFERLLDYTARTNQWRKFLYKLMTARSVMGTSFFKVVWTKRSHMVSLYSTQEETEKFEQAIQQAQMDGAPLAPSWEKEHYPFNKWRELVNTSGRFGRIPALPTNGPREVTEYEGPLFQYLPMWALRLDPLIDEIKDQKVIIHRMVKPLSYVTSKADNKEDSDKPYSLKNVEESMSGWDGQILEQEEEQLAEAMGLIPSRQQHPYFSKAVELWEIWSPEEDFKYSVVMNRKHVINKKPFENPLLTSSPNVFALRNVIVPGHFYGLSDYQESEKLFKELNQFRRIRMDGATLTTLPVFVKQAGVQLTEALKKIKPGMILTLPTKDAIQSLIRHQLPAEAYREPSEIKMEIEDATEVYGSTKGAPAIIGRVTGTEFQGRAGQVQLKFKVDASIIEDELEHLPAVILSLFAQMGPPVLRKEIGGDPDATVDVTREQLIQALGIRFRFRGATKNISPDLQVQQLTTAMKSFDAVLTPTEKRAALKLVMELMDIRGYSSILTPEGQTAMGGAFNAQQGASNSQAGALQAQGDAAQVVAPDSVPADAMGGGQ